MRRILLTIAAASFITGCSSTPKQLTPENAPDKVVSTSNGDDLPSWAKNALDKPFYIDGGYVVSVGNIEGAGDDRPSALFRVCQNDAKREIANGIQQKLEFFTQVADEGVSMGSQQLRTLSSETSKITTAALTPGRRFHQKIATTTDSGDRETKLQVFCEIRMTEADFKDAIQRALRGAVEKKEASAAFQKVVNAHWQQMVQGSAPSESREVASEKEKDEE